MKRLLARLSAQSGPAALIVSVIALTVSTVGVAAAVSYKGPSTKPRPYGVLVLDKNKRFPSSAIPKVRTAKSADSLSKKGLTTIKDTCPSDAKSLGTYCLQTQTYRVPSADSGKNNFFYASQACASRGGWLPTASELIGAAGKIELMSTIDDDPNTALVDVDGTNGLKDQREMSSTLVTTAAGSSAAGSIGVTAGSKGDPNQSELDPTPLPANPQPGTLQYVTVYDNKNGGGFGGSKAVAEPENFRCAWAKAQKRDQKKVVAVP
jgi:hypothetical protein